MTSAPATAVMSPRARLILILVIVALLFAITLVVRVFVPETNRRAASENALLSAIATLSPRVDLSRMNCNGRRADRTVTLTESQSTCQLRIPRQGGTEVRSVSVSLKESNPVVYVVGVFQEEKTPEAQRDPRTCITDENALAGFRLVVNYEPQDTPDGDLWSCFLKQKTNAEIKVVALENGGRLNLVCHGCEDPQRRISIDLN